MNHHHPRPTNEQIEAEKARLRELLATRLAPSRDVVKIRWVLAELEEPSSCEAVAEMSEEHQDLVVLVEDWVQGWTRTRPSEVFEGEDESE